MTGNIILIDVIIVSFNVNLASVTLAAVINLLSVSTETAS